MLRQGRRDRASGTCFVSSAEITAFARDGPRRRRREHSSGEIVTDVPRTVHDCRDYEDNLILDLAAEVGALLIVSNDTDLLSMSPWRRTPIIEPSAFAAKVGAMRRHARRRRRR
jgi:hypothetical protein